MTPELASMKVKSCFGTLTVHTSVTTSAAIARDGDPTTPSANKIPASFLIVLLPRFRSIFPGYWEDMIYFPDHSVKQSAIPLIAHRRTDAGKLSTGRRPRVTDRIRSQSVMIGAYKMWIILRDM